MSFASSIEFNMVQSLEISNLFVFMNKNALLGLV